MSTIGDYFLNKNDKYDELIEFAGKIIEKNLNDLSNGLLIWSIMFIFVLFVHYSLVLLNNFLQFRLLIKIIDDNVDQSMTTIKNGVESNNIVIFKQFQSKQQQSRFYQQILLDIIYAIFIVAGLLMFSTTAILIYDFHFIFSIIIMTEMVFLYLFIFF